MKNIKYIIILSSLILINYSCSKLIDEAYSNPNYDVRVPPETLLPQIIASMAANYAGHGPLNDIRYVGQYIQNFCAITGGTLATQSIFERMGYNNSDVAQSTWRTLYYDLGQNLINMIKWAEEEQKYDYVGVGNAIFAWGWLTIGDYYGEVILDNAFNNDGSPFTYQTQDKVYKKVIEYCNIALEKLNQTGGNVSQANLAKGDAYFFNGDIDKWKKFTYGILARAYSRGSNRADFNLADSVIFACNNSLTTNDDNGYVRFAATALGATNNFFGPFRANLTGTAVTGPTLVKQSKFIVDLMTGAANSAFAGVFDPRSFYMLRLNSSTQRTYRGVETLLGQGAITPTAAQPENFWGQASSATTIPPNDTNCRFIFRNNSPIPVITASEIAFIKAEILFKKGDKTGALAAYKDGIDKNIDMLRNVYNVNIRPLDSALTDAKKNAFLNNTKVVPANPAQLTLSNIMLQKYISLYIHGALETWVDMRKYHYTDLDPATNNQVYFGFRVPSATDLFQDNNGKLVYRMRPRFNSEYVWNINELKLIGATTPDYHTKQTWFSQ